MSTENRALSPKFEAPMAELEDDNLYPPPGPVTRSTKKKIPSTKIELDLSILLKFIKPYDGSRETLNSFLVNCSNAYDLATDAQKDILFKYILCQLQGKAQNACSIKEFTNWIQLKEFLKTQFSERKHYAHLLTDLQECKQTYNEPVSQYALRIETCLSQLLTEISISHGHKSREMIGRTAAMEELALHHFQMGLVPRISNIVRCRSPKTLNEAINIAISEEKIQQSILKHSPSNARPEQKLSNIQSKSFQIRRNQNPNTFNRNLPNNPNSNYPNRHGPSTSIFCRYCKTPGHTLEQCRKRQFNNDKYKIYQNQPRAHNINFVSDDPDDEHPDIPSDATFQGYDTVDCKQKNE